MRLTLSSALPVLARFAVQGACSTDPRVIEKINEARERLMSKPQNWKNKIQRFLFCSTNACITLPREIETVEAATVCNRHMKMRSKWYDVLEGGPTTGQLCGGDAFVDRGDGYVSFADLDEPRNIKIYADVPESSGARLLLQGFDENGNRVRTWDETSGAYVDGEYVTINHDTPAVSTTVFSSLDGIQKPETNGYVRVYAFTAGSAGAPATDTTVAVNWAGDPPEQGSVVWDGELNSASWSGTDQDLDFVLQIYYEPDVDMWMNLYSTAGVIQNNFQIASWSWTPNAGPVTTAAEMAEIGGFPLSVPPFTLDVSSIEWTPAMGHDFYLVFRGDGEGNGNGTLYIYDATLTEISANVTTIPAGPTYTLTPNPLLDPPAAFVSAILSGDADVSQLFTEGQNYGFHITQTELGTLNFVTDTDGITPTPPTWNATLSFTDILSPDLLNGTAFYSIQVTRSYTAAVSPVSDYLALMSILHPDETHPSYRRYEVPALRAACAGASALDDPRQVIVMAKLRYLPVKQGTDFLVIENIGALKHMLLAINEEEKGDLAKALLHEAKAEEILAQELRNHVGDSATANQGMQIQQDAWAASSIPSIL